MTLTVEHRADHGSTHERESDVYVGLSPFELRESGVDLGLGIVASPTFSHVFSAPMIAFSPAPPRGPSPGPWRAVSGGSAFDVRFQIRIPASVADIEWHKALNLAWRLVAMLRLAVSPRLFAPVLSDGPFESGRSNEAQRFWLLETMPRLQFDDRSNGSIAVSDLEWLKANWHLAVDLTAEHPQFDLLTKAVDQAPFAKEHSIALLELWGALESMFVPNPGELRFRLSALIAAYMEPPGEARLLLQRQIARLYDARSAKAHGRADNSISAASGTYTLARGVILKILAKAKVPTREELEGHLLGGL